jgi:hypothetical protein
MFGFLLGCAKGLIGSEIDAAHIKGPTVGQEHKTVGWGLNPRPTGTSPDLKPFRWQSYCWYLF